MVASFHKDMVLLRGNGRSLGSQRVLFGPDTGDPTLSNIRWQERFAPGADGWRDLEIDNPGAGGGGGGASALDELSDVTLSSPADGDVLAWDSSTGTWINDVPPSGGGGATPADTGTWTGTTSRSLSAKFAEAVSVKDYGAVGDGVAIDGPAIKAALEAADDVYCPPGVYLFDVGQMLQFKGKRLFGAPGKTIFRHTTPTADTTRNAFFYLGNMHPYWFDDRNIASEKFKRFAVTGAVAKGARVLTLTATPTGADATDLGAGKMVWVRHATEYARTGWAQPDFAQLVRVESLSGAVLTLERSVNEALASAIVSPIGNDRSDGFLTATLGTPMVAGLCEDCIFEDLIFEGGSEAFARMGAYRCTLRNIEHRKGLWGPLFNAFVEGLVSGYKCEFSTWAIEIRQACSETVFEKMHLQYRPITGVTVPAPWSSDNNTGTVIYMIDMGERSNRLIFRDLRLSIGPEWTGNQRTMDIADAWNITFEDTEFNISGGGDAPLLGIRGSTDAGSLFPTKDILFSNGNWKSGIGKAQNAVLYGGGPSLLLIGVRFVGNRWSGNPTNSAQHITAMAYCTDWAVIGDRCSNAIYLYGQRASSCLPPKVAGNMVGLS